MHTHIHVLTLLLIYDGRIGSLKMLERTDRIVIYFIANLNEFKFL